MITLGFGLGVTHRRSGVSAPASTGPLQVDGFNVLIDTFQINFS